jgi:murein DD-endopeptidase MepM/ murein hydrolase activator NlpD
VGPSPRRRYYERRQDIAGRRRKLFAIGAGIVVLLGALVWFLMPKTPQPVEVVDGEPTPTSEVVLGTSVATLPAVPTVDVLADPTPDLPPTPEPNEAAPYFHDQRLAYEPNFNVPELQAFLESQPGTLKNYRYAVGDRNHSFAEGIIGQTSYYGINPKVLLALLETQSGLITSSKPSDDQLAWAMGYRGENGNRRGLSAQVRWAVRQLLFARPAYANYEQLTYADNKSFDAPANLTLSEYSIARVLAPTTTPEQLPRLLQRFRETYTWLFDDPRTPPSDWPDHSEPFLHWPMQRPARVTSFFDHGGPFLSRVFENGVVTYWGRREVDLAIAYNGHDGWDYAVAPPDLILAAADGVVTFAGNADDGCATRAVVIDHNNGYRSLYWHLARVDVTIGDQVEQGQTIGMAGASGCATGPHLHFGVQYLGRNVDPYGWCAQVEDPWHAHPAGGESRWLWADRPSPCGEVPSDSVVVDTHTDGFTSTGTDWQSVPVGYAGEAWFIPSLPGVRALEPWSLRPLNSPSVAVWTPNLPQAGQYRVLAYVPFALSGLDDATEIRYHIRHSEGEAEIEINAELHANDWVDLGTYHFDPAERPSVSTSNLVEASERSVWADALLWMPVQE